MDSSRSESDLEDISTVASENEIESINFFQTMSTADQIQEFKHLLQRIAPEILGPAFEKDATNQLRKARFNVQSLDNDSLLQNYDIAVPPSFQMDIFVESSKPTEQKMINGGVNYRRPKVRITKPGNLSRDMIFGEIALSPSSFESKLLQLKRNMKTLEAFIEAQQMKKHRSLIGMIVINGDLNALDSFSDQKAVNKNWNIIKQFDEFYVVHMAFISLSTFAPLYRQLKESKKNAQILKKQAKKIKKTQDAWNEAKEGWNRKENEWKRSKNDWIAEKTLLEQKIRDLKEQMETLTSLKSGDVKLSSPSGTAEDSTWITVQAKRPVSSIAQVKPRPSSQTRVRTKNERPEEERKIAVGLNQESGGRQVHLKRSFPFPHDDRSKASKNWGKK